MTLGASEHAAQFAMDGRAERASGNAQAVTGSGERLALLREVALDSDSVGVVHLAGALAAHGHPAMVAPADYTAPPTIGDELALRAALDPAWDAVLRAWLDGHDRYPHPFRATVRTP